MFVNFRVREEQNAIATTALSFTARPQETGSQLEICYTMVAVVMEGSLFLGGQSDSSFSNLVVSPGSVSLSATVSLLSRGGIWSVIGEDLSRES